MIAAVWLARTRRLPQALALAARRADAVRRRAERLAHRPAGHAAAGRLGRARPAAGRAASALLLLLTPVVYALLWFGLAAWARAHAACVRRRGAAAPSATCRSSRFAIWTNTLALIARASLARRRLRRIQLRLVADAVPGPAGRVLRPHAQPAAAVRRRARPAARRAGAGAAGLGAVERLARRRARPRPPGARPPRARARDGADDGRCTASSSTRCGTPTSCCRRRSRSGCASAQRRPRAAPARGAAAAGRARACWPPRC